VEFKQHTSSGDQSLPGILVIDDEPAILGMLNLALRVAGFSVLLANNGQEALDLYRQRHAEIGALLLDVRMPGWDGPQTLTAIRAVNPAVRFCFMTGYSTDYSEQELLALGSPRVLTKPFNLKELISVLGNLTSGTADWGTPITCPRRDHQIASALRATDRPADQPGRSP
jgi:DNA-binding response OmpR family regulator